MTALVTKHLPLVVGAPDGVGALRRLILDLAVQGRLVPQRDDEGWAIELVQQIDSTRAAALLEGRAKKRQVSGDVPMAEHPFDIPSSWVWRRLGSIASTQTGSTPSRANPDYFGDGVPFIKPADIRSNAVDYSGESLSALGTAALGRSAPQGSLLMVCIGTIGKCNVIDRECAFNQQINAATLYGGLPAFLLLIARSTYFQNLAWEHSSSTTIAILNKGKWEALPVPVAPMQEQHRIVAKVDELMALCDRLEADQADAEAAHTQLVQALLGSLTQATDAADFRASWQRLSEHFHTLFTTEASIDALKQAVLQLAVMGKLVPKEANCSEWHWTTLGTLITDMDAGWSPACEDLPSPSPEVWGVLRTTAIQRMEYVEKENKQLPAHLDPRPMAEVKKGDVLFTRAGPMNRVGISCFVESTRPKLMLSDKIIRFRPKSNALDGRFTVLCLNAGATAKFLEEAKSGMAASQVNISQAKLKAAPIPTPPISEQLRIVAKVDELMALCDELKAHLQQARQQHAQLASVLVEQAVSA
jgi:type I restriction enzyme S subunit